MSELVFILTDFFARPASAQPAARASLLTLPRLPALETLLTRARREALSPDWRAWLQARVGMPARDAASTLASTVSAAWPAPLGAEPGEHQWLATPVHLIAGLGSVHLHPAGLLELAPPEQQRLAEQFAAQFSDFGWRLRSIGQRELLLSGPPLYASAPDPAGFAGCDPYGGLPQGVDAARLMRLGTELELWLHAHALNRQREARGELAITTLWLWGGARSAQATQQNGAQPQRLAVARALPQLFGRDTYAEALWRLHGAAGHTLPAPLSAAAALLDDRIDAVLLCPMSPQGSLAAFEQLEAALAHALKALRARRLQTLVVVAGAYAYRLSSLGLGRIWRRRAPWWELLA